MIGKAEEKEGCLKGVVGLPFLKVTQPSPFRGGKQPIFLALAPAFLGTVGMVTIGYIDKLPCHRPLSI